jgi:ribokinase
MKILNFGSLNIDHVYKVDHFARPGETLSCDDYQVFAGGKGNNQSIALGRAGAEVYHAGKLCDRDIWLKELLEDSGVNTKFIELAGHPSGHAIIQVNKKGQNSIVIFGGANQQITDAHIERGLEEFSEGDHLLVQNEINDIPKIIRRAHKKNMTIVFNPAPMTPEVMEYPLDLVDIFIVNEIEGRELTGCEDPHKILDSMIEQYPDAATVLTLGENGVIYNDSSVRIEVPAEKVKAVDTTAAGDCFIGYFLAGLTGGGDIESSLKTACKAAAICVTRAGAVSSIPLKNEI